MRYKKVHISEQEKDPIQTLVIENTYNSSIFFMENKGDLT